MKDKYFMCLDAIYLAIKEDPKLKLSSITRRFELPSEALFALRACGFVERIEKGSPPTYAWQVDYPQMVHAEFWMSETVNMKASNERIAIMERITDLTAELDEANRQLKKLNVLSPIDDIQ